MEPESVAMQEWAIFHNSVLVKTHIQTSLALSLYKNIVDSIYVIVISSQNHNCSFSGFFRNSYILF